MELNLTLFLVLALLALVSWNIYLTLRKEDNQEDNSKIEDIKTATLFKKKKSTFEPDFCAVKLPDNPWIVQPFEIYEELRIEDIKKKHQK